MGNPDLDKIEAVMVSQGLIASTMPLCSKTFDRCPEQEVQGTMRAHMCKPELVTYEYNVGQAGLTMLQLPRLDNGGDPFEVNSSMSVANIIYGPGNTSGTVVDFFIGPSNDMSVTVDVTAGEFVADVPVVVNGVYLGVPTNVSGRSEISVCVDSTSPSAASFTQDISGWHDITVRTVAEPDSSAWTDNVEVLFDGYPIYNHSGTTFTKAGGISFVYQNCDGCQIDFVRVESDNIRGLQNLWELVAAETPLSSSPPAPRQMATITSISSSLYLFGGSDKSHLFNDIWKWDGSTWSEISILSQHQPLKMQGHAAFSTGNDLFIFGGVFEDGTVSRHLERFSTASKYWSEVLVGPKPPQRTGFASTHVRTSQLSTFISHGGIRDFPKKSDNAAIVEDIWMISTFPGPHRVRKSIQIEQITTGARLTVVSLRQHGAHLFFEDLSVNNGTNFTFDVTTINGDPLPSWAHFDERTFSILGQPCDG